MSKQDDDEGCGLLLFFGGVGGLIGFGLGGDVRSTLLGVGIGLGSLIFYGLLRR